MTDRNTETKNNHWGEREFINDLNRVYFDFFFLKFKRVIIHSSKRVKKLGYFRFTI